MGVEDSLTPVYAAVPRELTDPWGEGGRYVPDLSLLTRLIGVQVDSGDALRSETGALARAVDVWIATELRRAALEPDAVFPRRDTPRQLPQAVSRAVARMAFSRAPAERAIQQDAVEQLIARAGGARVNILGGFFIKEIDVVMADWDRGLELAVSSKTMTGSFSNNLKNRFEEATGDLLNIRRRYPLAALGYVFLVTANILEAPNQFAFLKDMLRKLARLGARSEGGGETYDASCLLVVDYERDAVFIDEEATPADLAADQFFDRMLRALFERTRVVDHEDARNLWLESGPA